MPDYAVQLLGGFELRSEGRVVRTTPAAQRLLAFVATRMRKTSRTAVAQALWPDAPEARAAANLRSTLWRLRGGHATGPISSTAYGLELGPGTSVDVHALHATAEGLSRGTEVIVLDPGVLSEDVLPEWGEEWLLATREWFRQVRLHALEALCVRHCREGRFGEGLEAGLAAVACEPLRESAHRVVVQAHVAEGNTAEAVRQYRLYRRLLREELGLTPSARFSEMIAGLGVADTAR
ncbi:BTAD domain-containing putative transcriptional regulator [Actinomadura sp. DC4]|uniref:AfsR/SARP family transcriptional regulator n=1 Tax=Actinomadura sp. DC4 TaxID=3055069 RepID=UPI0025AF69F5|nr:BTAD domain-containing putative transcriptional regulator [Actinomadura sp. DC4]MDN3353599.1 BTAD domain-containing putative transcriptional regulator [Actinomadura sp. DC4]